MTPEQIRITIAESLGWTYGDYHNAKGTPLIGWLSKTKEEIDPPNYPNNLNAMQSAWLTLDTQHKRLGVDYIVEQLEPGQFQLDLTPRQWAIAYLKVKGLWK